MVDYKPDKELETFLERLLPPLVTYVFRKVLLYGMKVNIRVLDSLSRLYDFEFEAGVSDRDSWCWDLREKVPLYRASVEKVN